MHHSNYRNQIHIRWKLLYTHCLIYVYDKERISLRACSKEYSKE